MRIEIIDERYIVGIGFKNTGDIIDIDDDVAYNLIFQGLAKEKKNQKLIKQKEGE